MLFDFFKTTVSLFKKNTSNMFRRSMCLKKLSFPNLRAHLFRYVLNWNSSRNAYENCLVWNVMWLNRFLNRCFAEMREAVLDLFVCHYSIEISFCLEDIWLQWNQYRKRMEWNHSSPRRYAYWFYYEHFQLSVEGNKIDNHCSKPFSQYNWKECFHFAYKYSRHGNCLRWES